MHLNRLLLLICINLFPIICLATPSNNEEYNSNLVKLGQSIYNSGRLMNGESITAIGAGNTKLSGNQASCINCHKNTGLGGVEGNEAIPPITGHALFGTGRAVVVQYDKRFNKQFSTQLKPYDNQTFSEALRLGKHNTGRVLSTLMPKYNLNKEQLLAVSAYLKTLSTELSPGVSDTDLHLATVLTPNVSAQRKKIFLDTLTNLLNTHNANVSSGHRQRIPIIERKLNNRKLWKLQVWELKGPSSTWKSQLDKWQQETPVFSLLSGLSDDEWLPIQDFCETNKVVCWLPSIETVPSQNQNLKYSLFFTKGIALDAEVLVNEILHKKNKPHKILQLVNNTFNSLKASESTHLLIDNKANNIEIIDLVGAEQLNNTQLLNDKLSQLQADDIVIAWLTKDEIEQLFKRSPKLTAAVYLSTSFTGEVAPKLPDNWNNDIYLIQKQELSKLRALNLLRFNGWLKHRALPLVDEKLQSEVYFAFNSYSWMITSMLNNFYTDYLIERAQASLSMRDSMQVQEEVQTLMMGGGGRRPKAIQTPDDKTKLNPINIQNGMDVNLLAKRESISSYPRISLGNDQVFASKGAYIIKYNVDTHAYDENNAKWVVP